MSVDVTQLVVWSLLSVAVYFACTLFANKVENDYRREFQKPEITWREALPSLFAGSGALMAMFWLARTRLPFATYLPLALAGASLRGVWRVDRLLLLIPDRFQILGAVAGICYVAVLAWSGEDFKELGFGVAFALLLVGLLWGMSALYYRMRGAIGFGFGDIKLLAWLSFFVERRMIDVILLSIVFGVTSLVLTALVQSLRTKKITLPGAQDTFAFGPFIVLAVIMEELCHYA